MCKSYFLNKCNRSVTTTDAQVNFESLFIRDLLITHKGYYAHSIALSLVNKRGFLRWFYFYKNWILPLLLFWNTVRIQVNLFYYYIPNTNISLQLTSILKRFLIKSWFLIYLYVLSMSLVWLKIVSKETSSVTLNFSLLILLFWMNCISIIMLIWDSHDRCSYGFLIFWIHFQQNLCWVTTWLTNLRINIDVT